MNDFECMVTDEFGMLAGLDEHDRLPFLPLCFSSAQQIKSRLRAGIRLDDHMQALTAAGAAAAFYRYVLLRASMEAESFKAGEVSISGGAQSIAAAKALKKDTLAAVAHLLEDTEFVFRQVR